MNRINRPLKKIFLFSALASLWPVISPTHSFAQTTDSKHLFQDDTKSAKDDREGKIEEATAPDTTASDDVDFKAPEIEYIKETNTISGKGGIIISRSGLQVQADHGQLNSDTNDGTVSGNVVMTTPEGSLTADDATLNIDSETGDFTNARFTVEDGGYEVLSTKAKKLSEFEFSLDDSSLSTCHCLDGDRPWEINSSHCDITQEGYAHTYSSTVKFHGVPLLYSPWLAFPTKQERASGLLVPTYGYSNRDGFKYNQPLFLVLDDTSDITLTPFIENRTRIGSGVNLRKAYSTNSNIDTKLVYSDESRRGDSVRGVDTAGLYDPTVDTNRVGGYYRQLWRPDPELQLPVEFVADGHYVSDNLFLREIEDDDIGLQDSRYTESTAVARATFGSHVSAEASVQYSQALQTPPDLTFQRLPELLVSAQDNFRPFGFNPYGVKLQTGLSVLGTEFSRQEGYDGSRVDIRPRLGIPYHVQNYFRGQFGAELHNTHYSLNDNAIPGTTDELQDPDTRTVPVLSYGMTSGVERVYDVEREGIFAQLMGLGADNQDTRLVRVKHTVEPILQYLYIPGISGQDALPQYDDLDRIRQKSLITYGFKTRLYGRYLTPTQRTRDISELAPSVGDLPTLDVSEALSDFGRGAAMTEAPTTTSRVGEIREVASLSVKQSYDYFDDQKNTDPTRDAYSDIGTNLTLAPSPYFGFSFDSNYGAQEHQFSSYALGLGLRDDREDLIRTRYTFNDGTVSYIEGNVEVKMTDRLKLGYYARFDDLESEFIEQKGLVRFSSACNCWHIDVGVSDRINPDKQQILVSFTFAGLGDITSDIGLPQEDQDQQQP